MEYTGLIEFNAGFFIILLNVIVLVLVLKKFFFEKIYNFIQVREESIKDAFDSAEAVNRKADEKMENYNKQIAKIEEEGKAIIRDAKMAAETRAKEIIEEANAKASQMIIQAERQIETDRRKALEQTKGEVAALALLAAQKIVERDIERTGQDQIVDQIIEQVGKSGWQN